MSQGKDRGRRRPVDHRADHHTGQRRRARGRGVLGDEGDEQAGRHGHPAAGEGRPEPLAGAGQAGLDRPDRAPEFAGGVGVGPPAQAAEDERGPEPLGQPVHLLVEHPPGLAPLGRGDRVRPAGRRVVQGPHAGLPPEPGAAGPQGDPAGHPVQPPADRPAVADGPGPAGQDQEAGLGRVLGVVGVPEQPAAGGQDDAGVPPDEQLERALVPVADEPVEQVGVRDTGGPRGHARPRRRRPFWSGVDGMCEVRWGAATITAARGRGTVPGTLLECGGSTPLSFSKAGARSGPRDRRCCGREKRNKAASIRRTERGLTSRARGCQTPGLGRRHKWAPGHGP